MRTARYKSIKDYIQKALNEVTADIPTSKDIKIELSDDNTGVEWTGIKLTKLPSPQILKAYIDGSKIFAFKISLVSIQDRNRDNDSMIDYSSYLELLSDKLLELNKKGIKPDFKNGEKLEDIIPAGSSTLNFAENNYTGYVFDLTFNIQTKG